MRFGRRSRNPFSWRKHTKGPSEETDQEFTPVASEERDALLGNRNESETGDEVQDEVDDIAEEEHEDDVSSERDFPVDPTQRLLTALGRFQRQVARAREGQPQEIWVEECMNHLITAVEIALDQGWRELVNALTETARILQSYENAGKANLAAGFLADSNELLCLMVGDLIVGRIRPGVVDKWRQRYERAVQELSDSGIPLVTDEDEEEGPPRKPPIEHPPAEEDVVDQENVLVLDRYESLTEEVAEEKPDREEDTYPAASEVTASAPDIAEAVGDLDELDRAVESLIESLSANSQSETASSETTGELELPTPVATAAEVHEELTATPPSRRGLPEEVASTLDALCEDLAKLAESRTRNVRTVLDNLLEDIEELADMARKNGWTILEAPCQHFAEALNQMGQWDVAVDDSFLELAYGFCGLYGESTEASISDSDPFESWIHEFDQWLEEKRPARQPDQEVSEAEYEPESPAVVELEPPSVSEGRTSPLIEEQTSETVTPPEPTVHVVEPPQASGAPDDLLKTAHEAFAKGDVAQAKRLALEAAAKLAAAQVHEAETMVVRAEERMKRDAALAEEARQRVLEAEQEVEESERRMTETSRELTNAKAREETIKHSLSDVDNEIRRIEEEIRRLEQEREAAIERKQAIEDELHAAEEQTQRVEQMLESRRHEEQETRVRLEDLRQQVKTLERKRLDDDGLLEKARELLNRRRISLAEIEETISQICDSEKPQADTDSLLF